MKLFLMNSAFRRYPDKAAEKRGKSALAGFEGLLIFCLVYFLAIPHFFPPAPASAKTRIMKVGMLEESFWAQNKQDAKLALEVLFRSLSKKAKEEFLVEVNVFADLPSMIPHLKNGDVDLATIPSNDFVAIKDKALVEPILVGVKDRQVYVKYCLVVRRDGKTRILKELKGKRIAMCVQDAVESPRIWLDTILLKKEGARSKDFFATIKRADNVEKAVLPVYFGQTEACVITRRSFETESEMNPDIGRKLMIIEESPDLITSIICLRYDFDRSLKEKLINTAITIHEDPEGKQVLSIIRMDSIVQYRPDFIKNLVELLKEYNRLKSKR
jgi:ABC-type phosphate/phosphonate transport system substrate-binding protein